MVFRIGPSTIMDHLFEVFLCDAFRKRVQRIFRPYVRQIYGNFLTHFQIKSPNTIPLSQD